MTSAESEFPFQVHHRPSLADILPSLFRPYLGQLSVDFTLFVLFLPFYLIDCNGLYPGQRGIIRVY